MLDDLFKKIREGGLSSSSQGPAGPPDFLIVGLGNPGREYAQTWHNLGFMCLETLEKRHGFRCDRIRFKGLVGETRLYGGRQLWLKPQTYMNNSGESVREALNFYKLPPERCLIILDDFDLPLGTLRLREHGSSGTHNGMRSIIYQVQSDQMPRLRLGFGPKPAHMDVINYVLAKISSDQEATVTKTLDKAADAVETILRDGMTLAMSTCNGSVLSPEKKPVKSSGKSAEKSSENSAEKPAEKAENEPSEK